MPVHFHIIIIIIESCVKRAPPKENVLGGSTPNQPTFHSPPANLQGRFQNL